VLATPLGAVSMVTFGASGKDGVIHGITDVDVSALSSVVWTMTIQHHD